MTRDDGFCRPVAGAEQLLLVLGVRLVGVHGVGGHCGQLRQPDQVRVGGMEPSGSRPGGDGGHVGQTREYLIRKETLDEPRRGDGKGTLALSGRGHRSSTLSGRGHGKGALALSGWGHRNSTLSGRGHGKGTLSGRGDR